MSSRSIQAVVSKDAQSFKLRVFILQIIIGHDGKDEEHDWLLDEVIIYEPTPESQQYPQARSERLVFPCGRWISATKHDCNTQIALYPLGVGKNSDKTFCRDYRVRILTADVPGKPKKGTFSVKIWVSLFNQVLLN